MWKRTALFVTLLGMSIALADEPAALKVTVHLTGCSKLTAAEQHQITTGIERRKFARSASLEATVAEIAERVRVAVQDQGYFKAQVEPNFSIIRNGTEAQALDVSVAVQEGEQYRLKDITFGNEKAFPEAKLRRQFPLESGDIFDTEKIRLGLDGLRKLYGTRGYIDVTPVPDTRIDNATKSILLHIDVDEGLTFHFGKLIVTGEESVPGARDRLLAAWKPYEGSVYDGIIPPGFLRRIGFARGADPMQVFEFSVDHQNAVVNILVTLARLADFRSAGAVGMDAR